MSKFEKTYEKLYRAVYSRTGRTAETQKALDAISWYMYSGRMSLDFEERLNARTDEQIERIAERLIKNANRSYEASIKSVKQALGIRKSAL